MNGMKLISVIVPVYNVIDYLEQCIDSILGQSYTNLELILVDDGSTDGSGELCKKAAVRDKRVKLIVQENQGVAAARSAGVAVASGEYLSFIDADDWIDKKMYELLVPFVEQADLVSCGYETFSDEYGRIEKNIDLLEEGLYIGKEKMRYVWQNFFFISASGKPGLQAQIADKLFHRHIWEKGYNGDVVLSNHEDTFALHSYLVHCRSVYITHHVLYHYRQRKESASHKIDNKYLYKLNDFYLAEENLFMGHDFWNIIKPQLHEVFARLVIGGLRRKMGVEYKDFKLKYLIPFSAGTKGKRIVLYGAGEVGKDYYVQIISNRNIELVCWVDKFVSGEEIIKDVCIKEVSELNNYMYDCIIIGIRSELIVQEVKESLVQLGIERNKIFWEEPVKIKFL